MSTFMMKHAQPARWFKLMGNWVYYEFQSLMDTQKQENLLFSRHLSVFFYFYSPFCSAPCFSNAPLVIAFLPTHRAPYLHFSSVMASVMDPQHPRVLPTVFPFLSTSSQSFNLLPAPHFIAPSLSDYLSFYACTESTPVCTLALQLWYILLPSCIAPSFSCPLFLLPYVYASFPFIVPSLEGAVFGVCVVEQLFFATEAY